MNHTELPPKSVFHHENGILRDDAYSALMAFLTIEPIEVIEPESIFVCGPMSHNRVPGHYKVGGKRFSWQQSAELESRRGWIPRLRALAEKFGWAIKHVPPCGVYKKGHLKLRDATSYGHTTICLTRLPYSGEHTLPNVWRVQK